MKNLDLKSDDTILSSIIVHPHPIVEMQLKNFKKDEVGYIAECVLYNREFNKVESSFFIDDDIANKIIDLMYKFKNSKIN
jgi:hypothetical protein